jgi:hypothetical protein
MSAQSFLLCVKILDLSIINFVRRKMKIIIIKSVNICYVADIFTWISEIECSIRIGTEKESDNI